MFACLHGNPAHGNVHGCLPAGCHYIPVMSERRAYPRLDSDLPGLLECNDHSASPARLQLPVMVNTVSCEGASVEFYSPAGAQIRTDRPVTLHVAFDGDQHQVAGMVAWSVNRGAGLSKLGLRLELAATPAVSRHAYAEWITTRTRELSDKASSQRHAVYVAPGAVRLGRKLTGRPPGVPGTEPD